MGVARMGDVVSITSGDYHLNLHRDALNALTVGRLKKIMKIMLKAGWENDNDAAIETIQKWLQEDVAAAKGIVADAQKDLDDYWHPGLVVDKKVRALQRELKSANRDLQRAEKLLDYYLTERTKYYGNYDYD